MKRRLQIPAPNRRGFLTAAAGLFGATSLGGCGRIAESDWGQRVLALGEDANMFVQRLLLTPTSLAREFSESEISPWFKPNGTTDPEDAAYKQLATRGFEDFRLRIDGLVTQPLDLSLVELRALPSRTQITRHDCVEGWSAIGKWSGVPLSVLLEKATLKPQARFIVFHCADTMEYATEGAGESATAATPSSDTRIAAADDRDSAPRGKPIRYYESIDLVDAFHPQTIVAYELNGKPLPVSNGAPLRLRVERQLGYKQAKYIMRIEAAESLAAFGQGKGGYWEDNGYEWYAGI